MYSNVFQLRIECQIVIKNFKTKQRIKRGVAPFDKSLFCQVFGECQDHITNITIVITINESNNWLQINNNRIFSMD